jgi:hypothetical protein
MDPFQGPLHPEPILRLPVYDGIDKSSITKESFIEESNDLSKRY